MFKIFVTTMLSGIFLCVGMCAQSFAAGSGAYRLEIPDAGAIGKGMAFVGEANTPAAVYYNPAGMGFMNKAAVSVGVSLIQPKVDYTDTAGDETQMRQGSYTIPHMFFVSPLGEKFAVGFGALSSWGLTTSWNPDSVLRYTATKTVMDNKDFLISFAYKLNDQFSLALSMDIDDSQVDKQKKIFQGAGGPDANFRLKGADTGYGFRVAGLYKINERHQFGLMYRSIVQHKYHGKVHLDDMNNTYAIPGLPGTPTYQGVFGGPSYETEVVSKATLPDSVVLGYSYKPTSQWTFNADVEWMNWSVVNDEEVAYPGLVDPLGYRGAVLNDGNPIARDWHSAISAAVGAQYDMTEQFRLRMGYFHHQTPIPNDTWEPSLPDAVSHGMATGFGYDITKNLTLDLSWAGMYYMKRDISNDVSVLTGGVNGTYRQWLNLVYATLTYRF